MKAKTIVIIIASGLLVIGIALFLVGGFQSEFKFERDRDYVEKTYSVDAKDIKELYARDYNRKINLSFSKDDNINVRYFENKSSGYKINIREGELSVEFKDNRKWYEYLHFFGMDFSEETLDIEIPEWFAAEIELRTTNAGFDVDNMELKSKLELTTTNGKIKLKNITSPDISVHSTNGEIELTNIKSNDEVSADTTNGKIQANDVFCSELEMSTTNGSIRFENIDVLESVNARTTNGSIKGSVAGNMSDFNITSKTSNGDNNLPRQMNSGKKRMDIKTTNGNIDINFK